MSGAILKRDSKLQSTSSVSSTLVVSELWATIQPIYELRAVS